MQPDSLRSKQPSSRPDLPSSRSDQPSSRLDQPSRWTEINNSDTKELPSLGPSSAPPSLDRNNDTGIGW